MASSEPKIVAVRTARSSTRNRGSTSDVCGVSFGASLLVAKKRIWNSSTPVTAVSSAITDWKY
jgi:hypothetical protein